jgi:thymidylate synthase ThyX
MSAKEEFDECTANGLKIQWNKARQQAIFFAKSMAYIGLHKQTLARILEPYSWTTMIITSTNWANFYALRNHEDAQPEIQKLAQVMLDAHEASQPRTLAEGEWHLPFITQYDKNNVSASSNPKALDPHVLQKMSAARCARVSYLKHDGQTPSLEDDLNLYEKLTNGVVHASPLEHQACPPNFWSSDEDGMLVPHFRSNLHQWLQFRKLVSKENINDYKGVHR